MNRHSPRAPDRGTSLVEALPWIFAIDALTAAVREFLDGAGSEAELARTLHNYRQTARVFLGEKEAPTT